MSDTPRPPKRTKLPQTVKIVPNYYDEHKDLVTQLQSLANDLAKQLRSNLTDPKIGEEIDTKFRCNPVRAEAEQRKVAKRRVSDRQSPSTMYDPTDFIDQRFNASGYELAVSVSPEDAIVDALDAARAANVTLEDLLFGNVVITKQRGRGRPKGVKA